VSTGQLRVLAELSFDNRDRELGVVALEQALHRLLNAETKHVTRLEHRCRKVVRLWRPLSRGFEVRRAQALRGDRGGAAAARAQGHRTQGGMAPLQDGDAAARRLLRRQRALRHRRAAVVPRGGMEQGARDVAHDLYNMRGRTRARARDGHGTAACARPLAVQGVAAFRENLFDEAENWMALAFSFTSFSSALAPWREELNDGCTRSVAERVRPTTAADSCRSRVRCSLMQTRSAESMLGPTTTCPMRTHTPAHVRLTRSRVAAVRCASECSTRWARGPRRVTGASA
jgi:hypothetical protein